ncbi:uncharacterized protein LOC124455927 [Xenia sp. Carnegie-2017]|uniref:uncharacterized protein LOC124455927 n=1 Tax=Xenia sp. Carnegie-2017 TaxID=2897299 RepID=UPI001F036D6B|nr:uncharacterized protein LOC124455927 [Xenia sp. Carnegie-2017]
MMALKTKREVSIMLMYVFLHVTISCPNDKYYDRFLDTCLDCPQDTSSCSEVDESAQSCRVKCIKQSGDVKYDRSLLLALVISLPLALVFILAVAVSCLMYRRMKRRCKKFGIQEENDVFVTGTLEEENGESPENHDSGREHSSIFSPNSSNTTDQ